MKADAVSGSHIELSKCCLVTFVTVSPDGIYPRPKILVHRCKRDGAAEDCPTRYLTYENVSAVENTITVMITDGGCAMLRAFE
jgi:hypothetical protein